jgi:hypothetical protein
MAKPNYAFAKRQRDLAQKQKKEEKRKKKAESLLERPADDPLQPGVDEATNPEPTAGAVEGQS